QHTASPQCYPLSLHDALPISKNAVHASPKHVTTTSPRCSPKSRKITVMASRASPDGMSTTSVPTPSCCLMARSHRPTYFFSSARSEEHTSELQSRENLVCRLL